MAYNPYNDLNEIYKRKQNWTNANNVGDEEGKNRAAEEAKKYYASLSDNGYGDLSNEMSNAGLDRAKQLTSYYGMTNKNPVREYYYTLGKSRGLSKEDIDGLLKYNDVTGEIIFGGKNIGKPDSVIDGVSYIGDTSVLDNSFNEYMKRAGTTIPKNDVNNSAFDSFMKAATDKNNRYNDEMYGDKGTIMDMYKTILDYANQDVSETDEYKSAFKNIMPGYNVAANQAGYNAAASGAASNGGNIDSFAAANAMKNQQAMTAKGQALAHQMGLDTYNARLKGVSDILGNLGIYLDGVYDKLNTPIQNDANFAQQYFDNGETAKKNRVENDAIIAGITGKVPASMIYTLPNYAQYFNSDGSLKDENIDYDALLKAARERGDTEDEEALLAARASKLLGNYEKYRQYDDGDYAPPRLMDTESRYEYENDLAESKRQYNIDAALQEKALEMGGTGGSRKVYSGSSSSGASSSSSGKPSLTAAQARDAIKQGEMSQTVIDAYNYWYGTDYTLDNPPTKYQVEKSSSDKSSNSNEPTLSFADVDAWVEKYGKNDDKSAENYIKEHYKDLGYSNASSAIAGYKNHNGRTSRFSAY